MQVSTKLFNDQQVRQFGKLTADIQQKQEKIASGKAILRASDDPVAAVQLSAAREQEQLLTRFEENAYKAQNRLNSADKTLQETMAVITRISELATQARSPAYDGFSRSAILTEVTSLKESLVDLANTKDSYGQSLFSGFRTGEEAFARELDGTVRYNGDRGVHTLQVSENVTVASGVDGETVFGRVETSDGRKSIFEIVEGVMASIDPLREINELAVVQGKARVKLELPRQNQDWEFTLKGSVGAVTINVTLAEGMEENLATAINAKADQTGVTAEFDIETGAIFLTEAGSDDIIIENIEIEGQGVSNEAGFYHMKVADIDENGAMVGKERFLSKI